MDTRQEALEELKLVFGMIADECSPASR